MGTVIGIVSAKGGVGKTILATNLSAALGSGYHKKTILIDLNPAFGTADLLLDITPQRSWRDLIPVLDELNREQIRLAATEYRPSVDLLAAPPETERSRSGSMTDLSPLITYLKGEYDLTVIDFPTGINGYLSLMEIVVVLLTPDAPTLRSTSRFLTELDSGGRKVGAVINQYFPGGALRPEEIEDYLGVPVWGVMPIDQKGIWSNISFGEPCALKRSSQLGAAIREFAVCMLQKIGVEGD